MNLVYLVILLLLAILISNIINHFVPMVAVPVIQVLLGVGITLLPIHYIVEIKPVIFFTVFVTPLVYYSGMTIDKKAIWSLKKEIFDMAIVLVILTSIIAGAFVHILIPTIPLAAGMSLIATLCPTDDVAVDTVERYYFVPGKMMDLLKGESIFNDVSSIILFQIGISVIISGAFSPMESLIQFFYIAIGGILVGIGLSLVKILIIKWILLEGIQNETIHILISILFPVLTYLMAERLEVSGIVAIFVAGLMSMFEYGKNNPDTASLTLASKNIWSVISFSLEGMVFVILGMQLPSIIYSLWKMEFSVSSGNLIFFAVLICIALFLFRFLWGLIVLPKSTYMDNERPVSKWKAAMIFSLAGARGAVTLAAVYSIPIVLDNDILFPEREMMIVLTMGVTIVSIIVTYFILPRLIPKKSVIGQEMYENGMYLAILQDVIDALEDSIDLEENQWERQIVIMRYKNRQRMFGGNQNPENSSNVDYQLSCQIMQWKQENIEQLKERGIVTDDTLRIYMDMMNNRRANRPLVHIRNNDIREIMISTTEYVLDNLHELETQNSSIQIQKAIQEQEQLLKRLRVLPRNPKIIDDNILYKIQKQGLVLERGFIQKAYEQGKITFQVAKKMKDNITMVELQME